AAYLINSRFLINSTLSFAGIFGSRPVWIAIMMVMLLQIAFTYLPFMQLIFGSEGLSIMHWLAIILSSGMIYLLIEAEKMGWRILEAKQK
ncbi:MAG: cation transporting ATPase C-terminal domain-containing protein, partial [Vreelandella alkaliphila]